MRRHLWSWPIVCSLIVDPTVSCCRLFLLASSISPCRMLIDQTVLQNTNGAIISCLGCRSTTKPLFAFIRLVWVCTVWYPLMHRLLLCVDWAIINNKLVYHSPQSFGFKPTLLLWTVGMHASPRSRFTIQSWPRCVNKRTHSNAFLCCAQCEL